MEIGNVYECTTQFELPEYNCDMDEFEDETLLVERGSVWISIGQGYMRDREIRLENDNEINWIEISKECLNKYFKDITKYNNEMGTYEYLRNGY